jgi:MFS family permease
LFWFGSIFSNSGSWMQNIAQGWLVYTLTGSSFLLGVVAFARAIPLLFLPLAGGVVADRVPRLKLLKITQSTSLVLALIFGILVTLNLIQVWQIILLSFLSGIVSSFDQPTQQALLPDLVPREELSGAIALYSSTWQGSALFGPTLAGLVIAFVSVAGAFYANALSYLAVIIALVLMRGVPERSSTRTSSGMVADLRESFHFVSRTRLVATLLGLAAIASIFGRPYQQLLPVFATSVLHVGATGLGFMASAPGAGRAGREREVDRSQRAAPVQRDVPDVRRIAGPCVEQTFRAFDRCPVPGRINVDIVQHHVKHDAAAGVATADARARDESDDDHHAGTQPVRRSAGRSVCDDCWDAGSHRGGGGRRCRYGACSRPRSSKRSRLFQFRRRRQVC